MSSATEYGTLTYVVLGAAAVPAVLFLLSLPTGLGQWLKEKNYQYELTSGLYMLTPTEKFVFNSILFMLGSMTLVACFLYLPSHVMIITERAFYYWGGDSSIWQQASHLAQEALNKVGNLTATAMHDL